MSERSRAGFGIAPGHHPASCSRNGSLKFRMREISEHDDRLRKTWTDGPDVTLPLRESLFRM